MREKQNAKMRFEFPPQENQTLAQMFGFIEVRRDDQRERLQGLRYPNIITATIVAATPNE